MEFDLPPDIEKIVDKLIDANYQIYLVGGAVRDFLLNQPIKDYDFTTDATPEQILNLFPEGFYDNKFGTVGISVILASRRDQDQILESTELPRMTNPTIVEITTMRKEGDYHDSRHPDQVAWTNKVEEDLKRRDFTINAMAINLLNEDLVDPFSGQTDLKDKTIRAVGEPDQRFHEDALRLIRAVRFANQLGFTIEPATLDALSRNTRLIENISTERIRDELLKILATDSPLGGVTLLRQTGLLQFILPELERCFGVVQAGPRHDRVYDIGEHSLLSLKFCPSNDPIVRLAALIHDIGKPDTYHLQPDGNATFYHHEVIGAKIAKTITERFHFSRKQIDKIVSLVRWHLFTVDENQTDSAIRRFIKNVGLDNLDDMWAIREADRLGGGTQTRTSWRHEKFKDRIKQVLTKPFSVTDLKVNGQDVMKTLNIPPSRRVGEVLDQLFQEVSVDATKNDRQYLLNQLEEIAKAH